MERFSLRKFQIFSALQTKPHLKLPNNQANINNQMTFKTLQFHKLLAKHTQSVPFRGLNKFSTSTYSLKINVDEQLLCTVRGDVIIL